MKLILKIGFITCLAITTLLFTNFYPPQKDDPLKLKGTIKNEEKKAQKGVIVTAYCNDIKVADCKSNILGNFSLAIPVQKEFEVELSKSGFVSQIFLVSANVPSSELGGGSFEQDLDKLGKPFTIFKMLPGLDISKMKKPVARLYWDDKEAEWFTYDKNIKSPLEEMLAEHAALKKKLYDAEMDKANKHLKADALDEAWYCYEKALEYDSKQKAPKNKIQIVKQKMALKEKDMFVQYQNAVAKADELAEQNEFNDAKIYYNKALTIKEVEQTRLKLTNLEEKQELFFEGKRNDYDRFITSGEEAMEAMDYSQAFLHFKDALEIFPDEQFPKTRMAEARQLGESQAGELTEAEKQRLAEEQKRKAEEAEKQRLAEEQKQKTEEAEKQRLAEEQKQKAEEAEKQRLAEEQKQKAEEAEKQRLAEEQKQKTEEAEKQRLAEEQKRKAEEAEKQRLAEEQKRKAEEAEKQRLAEEQKRKAEEAEKQRLAEEQKRKAEEAEKSNAASAKKEKEYANLMAAANSLFKNTEFSKAKAKYQAAYNITASSEVQNLIAECDQKMAETLTASANNSVVNVDNKKDSTDEHKENQLALKGKDDINSYLDALKKAQASGDKAAQIALCNSIAKKHEDEEQLGKALEYYKKMLALVEESDDKSAISDVYSKIALVHRKSKGLGSALENYQKALDLKEETGDRAGASDVMNEIAVVYYDSGRYESTVDYYEKALDITEELGNKDGSSKIMQDLGVVLENTFRYDKSIEYYEKSYQIKEEQGDDQATSMLLDNIGNVYIEQKDYDKAIKFLELSMEKDEKLGNKKDIAAAMNNIGVVYYNKGDFNKSVEYYESSIQILDSLGENMQMAISYNNLGNVNFDWKKYTEALEYYTKSLKIKEGLDYKQGMAKSLHNIGNVHNALRKFDEAIKYYTQSNDIATEMGLNDLLKLNYKALANAYGSSDDFESAFKFFSKLSEKMSEGTPMIRTQLTEVQSKYDSYHKENQIAKLRAELRKQKLLADMEAANREVMEELKNAEIKERDEKIKRQNFIMYTFILGFVIILIFSILLARQSNQRRKANKLLEKKNGEILQQKEEIEAQRDEIESQRDFVIIQKNQIEDQKQEITDSIIYASLIQGAILPPEAFRRRILPDHFVLYKPRDIVSGDFFWMSEIDSRVVFVAADCTGHGVPGAFMSMLGLSHLNEIVNKEKVHSSEEILNRLRAAIISSLHQEENSESKDGMDISLCILDKETLKMEFSGAYNPLIYVRGNEMNKVTADRMPIGIHSHLNTSFTKNEVQLEKDDVLYIFSDGYHDQFGGEEGKKLKSKPFQQLLLSIHQMPMQEQKSILNKTFEEWRGSYDQIDDILVLGMRV